MNKSSKKYGISKEAYGCLGAIIAAIITGICALTVALPSLVPFFKPVFTVIPSPFVPQQIQTLLNPTNALQIPLLTPTLSDSGAPIPSNPMPSPSPTYQLPVISSSTPTLEPNIIFSDSFDTQINPAYWQQLGTWMITNGQPILVNDCRSGTSQCFYYLGAFVSGGILLPSAAQLNNYAIEYDFINDPESEHFNGPYMWIILAYQDEKNFIAIPIQTYGEVGYMTAFINGQETEIPSSEVKFSKRAINHLRIEIRGTNLKLIVNDSVLYEFYSLPVNLSGIVGIAVGSSDVPLFDNFALYQLPK
jgi:hypothetical protein